MFKVHIGSQILSIKPYQEMLKVVNKTIKLSNYNFKYIDLEVGWVLIIIITTLS